MTAAQEKKYRYYLLGDYTAIRTTVDPEYDIDTDAVYASRKTGKLEENSELLHRIRVSDEVESMTEEQFRQHCEQIFAEKKTDPDVPNPGV